MSVIVASQILLALQTLAVSAGIIAVLLSAARRGTRVMWLAVAGIALVAILVSTLVVVFVPTYPDNCWGRCGYTWGFAIPGIAAATISGAAAIHWLSKTRTSRRFQIAAALAVVLLVVAATTVRFSSY